MRSVCEQTRQIWRHEGGAAAVEFAMLSTVFISLILGIIQFSLYFVAALTLRTVLSETVAYASVFSNTTSYEETRDQTKVREAICEDLILVSSCTQNLKLEQMPLASLPKGSQIVSGVRFESGVPGDVLVRRAEAQVFTFVPGLKPLRIRSSSVFLRR